jgi:hypothetical protein
MNLRIESCQLRFAENRLHPGPVLPADRFGISDSFA